MATGTATAIRGSRPGGGPPGEPDSGITPARTHVSFWCVNRHETRPGFAVGAPVPAIWDCPRCGSPAGRDRHHPPSPPPDGPSKTHLDHVRARRTTADLEELLSWALSRLPWAVGGEPVTASLQPAAGTSAAAVQSGLGTGQPKGPARSGPRRAGTDKEQAQGTRGRATGRRGPARSRQQPRGSAPPCTAAARPVKRPGPASSPAAPSGEWCEPGCGYRLDSPSHRGICLGQW